MLYIKCKLMKLVKLNYSGNYINPLSANGNLSRHENLTFLWTLILRWVPRSVATHASLWNTLSSNKLCPKIVKTLAITILQSDFKKRYYLLSRGLLFECLVKHLQNKIF